MNDLAIRFDRVSKHYRLRRGWSLTVREEATRLYRRLAFGDRSVADRFWALRDVTFDVGRGETLGLIGANGAGKSTLLKILSRVSVPSAGSVRVRGKVGALIEIGAGFHPELTGRENIYLNGTIMGMRRAEVDEKFESIVAFAELAKFIDTPIKHYSSGMEMRLGFAVAAHIDPDVLLVDEVLAVGDAAFQVKCLNKLAELREQQKTIILVSHVLPNVLKHSDRVLWVDRGTIRAFGDPERTVEEYLGAVHAQPAASGSEVPVDAPVRIHAVTIRDSHGRAVDLLEHGREATVEVAYEVAGALADPVLSITFHDAHGYHLGGLTTRLDGVKLPTARERAVASLVLSPVLFARGAYSVTVAIYDERIQRSLDFRSRAATFSIEGPGVASRELSGHVVYPHRWDIEP